MSVPIHFCLYMEDTICESQYIFSYCL